MSDVQSGLDRITALVDSKAPFANLEGTVFLDAQAVIQWIRLGVFEKVLSLLPIGPNYLRRFRIQDAAFNEVVGVLAGQFGVASHKDVASYLRSHKNLQVDGPLEVTSPVGKRALSLHQRMCIQTGLDPAVNVRTHLGEAETLAMIEHHEPGSLFVTADKGAIEVAKEDGFARVVRPLAFVGGVLHALDDVIEVWKYVCLARLCRLEDDWDLDCVDALQCIGPTVEAKRRSPLSGDLETAVGVLDWIMSDLGVLIRVVESSD